jgi:hypothetical protein
MAALTAHSWVLRDSQTGAFILGPAVSALSGRAAKTPQIIRARIGALANSIDAPVFVVRRVGYELIVTETAGGTIASAPTRGLKAPLIAPFGREFMAWADTKEQRRWLQALGPVPRGFRDRIAEVFGEIRNRGFAVERYSEVHERVRTALAALGAGGHSDTEREDAVVEGDDNFDVVTVRLATAIAELTTVDFTAAELKTTSTHRITSIAAPIQDTADITPVWCVEALCFRDYTTREIFDVGDQLRRAAVDIAEIIAAHGQP